MKKILSLLALGATILSTTASADFTRVEAGVGAWSYKPSGTIIYKDNDGTLTDTSREKSQTSAYVWMLIKHPIPVLPNIRLEYASVHDDGDAEGSYDGYTFPQGTKTTWDVVQYDIIPYYNIIDNTFWATVDLGVDIKIIQSDFTAKDVYVGVPTSPSDPTTDYNEKDTVAVPLAYLRGRVEIPMTNIGFEADAKYISYDGDTIYDIRAKVDYTLDFIPVIQPAIELGYRAQKYDFTSDDKKTKVNMDFGGIYMGIMARF